jgi:flagellar biosynthetic protein FliQ
MDTAAVELSRAALWQCLTIGGPLLAIILLVGVILSAFQAVTNVHDVSVGFIPKLLVVAAVLMLGMPWLMASLGEYSRQTFGELPRSVRPQTASPDSSEPCGPAKREPTSHSRID